ncbi:hypothetical protein [Pseudophaeobacter sp.]|uniref:hypothetical protein n=1 Tax=Pseudophaeobacter sp. TaxID=1971739 RepID=UPI0032983D39
MLRGLSKWQLPILTIVDRSGARCFERIPIRNHSTIKRALSPMLAPDAVHCTDAYPAYKALSKAQDFEHFIVRSKPSQKTMSASYHIQNVNSLHSASKIFFAHFSAQPPRIAQAIFNGSLHASVVSTLPAPCSEQCGEVLSGWITIPVIGQGQVARRMKRMTPRRISPIGIHRKTPSK